MVEHIRFFCFETKNKCFHSAQQKQITKQLTECKKVLYFLQLQQHQVCKLFSTLNTFRYFPPFLGVCFFWNQVNSSNATFFKGNQTDLPLSCPTTLFSFGTRPWLFIKWKQTRKNGKQGSYIGLSLIFLQSPQHQVCELLLLFTTVFRMSSGKIMFDGGTHLSSKRHPSGHMCFL